LGNAGGQQVRLGRVEMACWPPECFEPRLDCGSFRQLVHKGSFSGGGSGVKVVGRPGPGLEHGETGNMLAVYQHEDGQGLLLGVLPPLGPAFSEFRDLHDQPHMEGCFGFTVQHVFECAVDPGGSVFTSPLVALAGHGGVPLMQHYAGLWRQADAGRCPKPPAIGWNSWDFFSGAVTRQAMDANLQTGLGCFGDALRYLVIDEGWEQQWGSWEPNGKFAAGLAGFCSHVRSRGLIPNI
jgi:hypothetical protein